MANSYSYNVIVSRQQNKFTLRFLVFSNTFFSITLRFAFSRKKLYTGFYDCKKQPKTERSKITG